MTTSTLNFAAQSADSALEHERNVLDDLRRKEAMLGGDLDRTQEREKVLIEQIGQTGRERLAQEQRVAQIERAMTDQAEALIKTMVELGLEPQQTAPPSPLTDVLGLPQNATLPDAGPLTVEPQARQSHEDNPVVTLTYPAHEQAGGGELAVTHPDGQATDVQVMVQRGRKVPVKRGSNG